MAEVDAAAAAAAAVADAAAAEPAGPTPFQLKSPYYAKRIELFERYFAREGDKMTAAAHVNDPIKVVMPDGGIKEAVRQGPYPSPHFSSALNSCTCCGMSWVGFQRQNGDKTERERGEGEGEREREGKGEGEKEAEGEAREREAQVELKSGGRSVRWPWHEARDEPVGHRHGHQQEAGAGEPPGARGRTWHFEPSCLECNGIL